MTVDSAIFFDSTFDPVKKIYYLLTEYQSYWTVLGVDVIKGTIAVNTTLLDISIFKIIFLNNFLFHLLFRFRFFHFFVFVFSFLFNNIILFPVMSV